MESSAARAEDKIVVMSTRGAICDLGIRSYTRRLLRTLQLCLYPPRRTTQRQLNYHCPRPRLITRHRVPLLLRPVRQSAYLRILPIQHIAPTMWPSALASAHRSASCSSPALELPGGTYEGDISNAVQTKRRDVNTLCRHWGFPMYVPDSKKLGLLMLDEATRNEQGQYDDS